MSAQTENLVVGLFALVLLPVIGWRVWRGVRDGRLPLYRTSFERADGVAKFNVLLGLHVLVMLVIAVVAVDLLFGLGLKERFL
jgi:hypothetical protein